MALGGSFHPKYGSLTHASHIPKISLRNKAIGFVQSVLQ